MTSSSDEEEVCATLDPYTGRTLQLDTQKKIQVAYRNFLDWKESKNYHLSTEDTFLEYFQECTTKYKPTTLWCNFSMLRTIVKSKEGVDIKNYNCILDLLKKHAAGFKSRKSKVFTDRDIEKFLKEAPDGTYLAIKVALIFGINGSCSSKELLQITEADVKQRGKMLTVTIKNPKNKNKRTFPIYGKYYHIVKKFMDLRSKEGVCKRFFQHYIDEKCVNQPIGIGAFIGMPKKIATFLGLPNPNEYTGICFKKSSMALQRKVGTLNVLPSIDSESQSNTDDETFIESCKEKLAKLRDKRTDPRNMTEPLESSNETCLKGDEANADFHENKNENSSVPEITNMEITTDSNPKNHPAIKNVPNSNSSGNPSPSEDKNEKSGKEMDFLKYEVTFSPLIKEEPEQDPCLDKSLTPPPMDHDRSNRREGMCYTFENTSYDSNTLHNLSQTVKMTGKSVTIIFNNCTFINCFNK